MKHSAPLWILSVLAVMLAVGWLGSRAIPTAKLSQPSQGEALIGGHFELVNAAGKTVTEKDFAGKTMLVFFGFTHCPDFCPTALLTVQSALADLGADADKITPIFITIDPARDTPEVMGKYVAHFGPRMVGLSGSAAQIRQVADAYKVYYSKMENEGDPNDYMMDHSGFIYLMDGHGKYIAHFPATIAEPQLRDALAKAVR